MRYGGYSANHEVGRLGTHEMSWRLTNRRGGIDWELQCLGCSGAGVIVAAPRGRSRRRFPKARPGASAMSPVEQSIHEVDFCGQVASAANVLFREFAAAEPADAGAPAFPFGEARVEGFGTGAARRKRKDLRIFERVWDRLPAGQSRSRLALCGEVKLPGTPEGRSAFDDRLLSGRGAEGRQRRRPLFLYVERQRIRPVGPEPVGETAA